tara:strand:+ start:2909 stop:3100 length:192 start_codon:yes stop_codon:yes gene_type:complete
MHKFETREHILLHRLSERKRENILLEELDLLKHILSINKIRLTGEVMRDAQQHLDELTKELVE